MSKVAILELQSQRANLPWRVWLRLLREVKAAFWRQRLGAFGRGSSIGSRSMVTGHQGICIGDRVAIWHSARLEALSTERGRGQLMIGDGTIIHPYVHIGCAARVSIGRGVLMASAVYITDHDHDFDVSKEIPTDNRRLVCAAVNIGDGCWIGEKAMILKGVTIGPRCIIGAGAVVTHDIPSDSVAIGVPARVRRRGE